MTTNSQSSQEPRFNWSDVDIYAAQQVLLDGQGARPPRDVIVLTDEEIVVLDGLNNPQLVPTPYLEKNNVDIATAAGTALRGLLARELVSPVQHETPVDDAGQLKLTATKEILGALTLRRTAQAIVQVERQTNAGQRWIFSYVHEDLGVLIEDIDDNGLHVFGTTDLDGAQDFIYGIVNESEYDGSISLVTHQWSEEEFTHLEEMPEAFEGAEATHVIAAMRHDSDTADSCVIYSGPQTLGLLEVNPDGSFTGSKVTADRVRQILATAFGA